MHWSRLSLFIKQTKQMKRIFLYAVLFLILLITSLYGYTQYAKRNIIHAVLKQRIDLDNPPANILAITTFDQTLYNKRKIPKGTRLFGNLIKDNDTYTIFFNRMQEVSGKETSINGKLVLARSHDKAHGISAKLGKTLHSQTRTNIIGAIFQNPQTQSSVIPVLQSGTSLKIEIE